MAAVCLALAAAVCYAAAMVLEQHSASRTGAEMSLRPSLLADLARRPAWLAGIAANIVGYALRFAALGRGSLLVVQPLLGTSLLFALPASARWHRDRLRAIEWAASLAIVAGLAMFLVPAGPAGGRTASSAMGWAGAIVVVTAATIVLLWRASTTTHAVRAGLLAGAGGLLLALAAAFTKVTAVGAGHDVLHLPLTWAPYALLAAAGGGVLVVQSAFAAAPLRVSLPVLMVVEPLASIALGAAVFGDRIARGAPARLVEAVGLALMTAGIVAVASAPALAHRPDPTAVKRGA